MPKENVKWTYWRAREYVDPSTYTQFTECDLRRTLRAQEVEYGVIDMVC